MVQENVKAPAGCPHPDRCPFGAKAEGYPCRMVFEIQTPSKSVFRCAFCELQLVGFGNLVAANNAARGGIVLAGPGALPPPGNNGG